MDFLLIAEKFGFPAAVLILVSYAVYRAMIWLGEKVIMPVTESHISLVGSMRETNTANSKTLEKVSTIMEVKAGTLGRIEHQNEEILLLSRKNHDLLEDLKKLEEG